MYITYVFFLKPPENPIFLEFGLYVDKHGDPCRTMGTIEWEGTAERVAFHAPYILLFDSRFIEIRHVETGLLVQIIPGSDVRCIWDGRGVSTSSISPLHEDSQEAQVHVVMNASDSTNGPGALKNKSIVQHVCELIPTIQLFPSDTNSTTGAGQDGAATPSNTSYVTSPQGNTSPGAYSSSVNTGFASPASAYSAGYVPSPAGSGSYAPPLFNMYSTSSPNNHNNVYPSPLAAATTHGTIGHNNAANKYVSPQSQSSINLTHSNRSSGSGGGGGGGGGNGGYFPSTTPSRPPASELYSSRSFRP